ncbi:MAG: 3D domain-containing protein [Acidobacteria bacterium]|nr:3D domain-containing protein [Acidobacteriota bacterium]
MPYVGGAAAYTGEFPFGSRIGVPGLGVLTVNDTGGAVGWGHIDAFFASCAQAIEWGTRTVRVTVYG